MTIHCRPGLEAVEAGVLLFGVGEYCAAAFWVVAVVDIPVALVVSGVFVPAWDVPLPGSSGMFHRPEGYNGYTWIHLPVSICNPPEFKKTDANFAIFAARMARSNLWIRSLLIYGFRAFKRACSS